jgi:hypothetical protein
MTELKGYIFFDEDGDGKKGDDEKCLEGEAGKVWIWLATPGEPTSRNYFESHQNCNFYSYPVKTGRTYEIFIYPYPGDNLNPTGCTTTDNVPHHPCVDGHAWMNF